MGRKVFEIEGIPTLSIVECRGDLSVQGSPRPEVCLRTDDESLNATREGDTIMVTCKSDLRVEAPFGSILRMQTAAGDVVVKRIQGSILIESVKGDLILSRVGPATVQEVRGDLSARVVDGDLAVREVRGDVSIRNIGGQLEIDQVGRDLGVRELLGDAVAENVKGDVRIRTQFHPDKTYRFTAGGDIVVRVFPDTDADFSIRSAHGDIRIKAPLADREDAEGMVTGRLGEGGASVSLEAGKDVVLVARGGDWMQAGVDIGALGAEIDLEFGSEFAGLADEIAAQVQAHMEVMSVQLDKKLSHLDKDLAAIDHRATRAVEKTAEQARKQVEQAAERIRRQAEREAEKARRRAERARWKAARVARTRPPKAPKAPKAPLARVLPVAEVIGEPVSDSERLAILNMVAEGKISIDEAETLLEALSN